MSPRLSQTVTLLWLEPGGYSPRPSSRRACAIMPADVPMSEPRFFRYRRDVTHDDGGAVLADVVLRRIDVEDPRSARRFGRVSRDVGHGRLLLRSGRPGRPAPFGAVGTT